MDNIIINQFKKSRIINNIRNKLLLRPSIYLKPKSKDLSVSDFFFWNSKNNFRTKIYITNLASQILPDIKQDDFIKIIIYESNGIQIDEIDMKLKAFETREFFFDDKKYLNKYGSFFIFHKFKNMGDLIRNGCHIAERGYTGYKKDDGVWNFVHGNHYSASLLSNGKIQSLLSTSLFKSNYRMQVSFVDSYKSELILNNPSDKNSYFDFLYFDTDMKQIDKESLKLKGKNTKIYKLSKKKFKYLEIESNIIFCRPLVLKHYNTYFDIFHA